jgi:MYXO-CTERM domain-containing protein
MRIQSLIAVGLLGLMTTAASAAPLPAGSDYSYEGDTLGAPITNFFEGTGSNTPNKSVSGGVFTITDHVASGDNYVFARSLNSAGHWPQMQPTFTIDANMQRGPLQAGATSGGNASTQLPGFTAYMGSTGRVIVYLGNYTGGQQYVNDSSTLTLFDDPTGYHVIDVPGLNIDAFNNYRLVGTGGGQYKFYVNDIATPVLASSLSPNTANQLNFGFESVNMGQQFMVDFIRADADTAFDTAPGAVPEPAAFSLLAMGGALLLRRRQRADEDA